MGRSNALQDEGTRIIQQQEAVFDHLDKIVDGSIKPKISPEKAAAIEGQRNLEATISREHQAMFDKFVPINIKEAPEKYDEQRIEVGLRMLRDHTVPAEKRRVIREHINDILGRVGKIEFANRRHHYF